MAIRKSTTGSVLSARLATRISCHPPESAERGIFRLSQVRRYPGFQYLDQLGRHKCVVVRNIQAYDACMLEGGPKTRRQLPSMLFLHDEDDVRPRDQVWREWVVCVGARTGRCHFKTRVAGEYLLRGWTALAVFSANKEDVFHRQYWRPVRTKRKGPGAGLSVILRKKSALPQLSRPPLSNIVGE